MSKNKEKIIIVIIAVLIILAIFMAFLFSNSQKEPAELSVSNDDKKVCQALMGSYRWKVFGTEIIGDGVDLEDGSYYGTNNTIISKPHSSISITSKDKFSLESVYYVSTITGERADVSFRMNDSINSASIDVPGVEGNYIFVFKLLYGKGEAFYGTKVVITDANVYEASEFDSFKNTSIVDIKTINEIISKLPYADEANGIIADADNNSLRFNYIMSKVQKEDLLNHAVALFVLIPDLNNIWYNLSSDGSVDSIYFSRAELNDYYNREISDYSKDIDAWMKEVIYREKKKIESDNYQNMIFTALEGITDVGDYLLINFVKDANDKPIIDDYEITKLVTVLNKSYNNIVVSSSDKVVRGGTLIRIEVVEKLEDKDIIEVSVLDSSNNQTSVFFERTKDRIQKIDDYQKQVVEPAEDVPSGDTTTAQDESNNDIV